MSSWIDLHALWQILVVGLLAGAGLPAVFAVGLRALSMPGRRARPAGPDSDHIYGGNPAGAAVAGLCFALVLAAIGYGIYLIVAGS
ncbi:MAG TPA: hypothetical protein VH637_12595 [Streptosporangiaceae bacterium]|jgi:hypothetical protein